MDYTGNNRESLEFDLRKHIRSIVFGAATDPMLASDRYDWRDDAICDVRDTLNIPEELASELIHSLGGVE